KPANKETDGSSRRKKPLAESDFASIHPKIAVLARLPAAIKADTMSAPVHAAKNPAPFKPGCFRYQTGDLPPSVRFMAYPIYSLSPSPEGEGCFSATFPLSPAGRPVTPLHSYDG